MRRRQTRASPSGEGIARPRIDLSGSPPLGIRGSKSAPIKGRKRPEASAWEDDMLSIGNRIATIAAATLVGLMAAGWAHADEFMDKVKAEVQMFAGPQSDWRGPTEAPKPD